MNKKLIANAALLAVLAAGTAAPAHAAGKEKCYGVAKRARTIAAILLARIPVQDNRRSIMILANGKLLLKEPA